jgi:protein-tyrosine phosphatase
MIKVMFVCLGNICRSPTAHGVFASKVAKAGLSDHIEVASAGTAGWHCGNPPDPRAISAAGQRGYDLSPLRAEHVASLDDMAGFDYILAMDADNLSNLEALAGGNFDGQLTLLLDYLPHTDVREVPDPYYGGDDGFDYVLDLIEQASDALLAHISQQHGITPP